MLRRAQSVALARPVDARDARVGQVSTARRVEHRLDLLRIRCLGQLCRPLTEGGRAADSLMPNVVGADGVGSRMKRAKKYREVEVEAEAEAEAEVWAVVESMRSGVVGRKVI